MEHHKGIIKGRGDEAKKSANLFLDIYSIGNSFLVRLLVILTLFFGILTIAGALRRFHWGGDLAALVVDYLFVAMILLLVGFVVMKQWPWAVVASVLAFINGVALVNYAAIDSASMAGLGSSAEGDSGLRLMVYNIYHQNPDLDAVVAEVRKYNPDLLFLMEYSDAIQAQVEAEFADYPHQLIRPSRMTMGLALFSRIPFEDTEIHRFQETRIPIFQAVLRIDGMPVTFVGGHSWPPQPRWGQLHRDQVGSIAAVASQSTHPLVVAGDFNASQWSYAVQNLAELAGVANILRPFNLTKTSSPVPFVGLPIDHVLVSGEFGVERVTYGDRGGSDHKPIIVDLQLK